MSSTRHHKRRVRLRALRVAGFTLVELLVVIAIIGVLLGILLPAVQAAREAARKSSCLNNLKQIGLALQNYHGQYGRFPPAAPLFERAMLPSIGWRVLVLPFLEETTIYDEIGPTPDGGAANWNPQKQAISVYLCPSEERPLVNGVNAIEANYTAVSGAYRGDERIDLEDSSYGDIYTNGIFYPESKTTIAQISDGTSHTLAMGETWYVFLNWMDGAIWFGKPPKAVYTDASKNIRYPINADQRTYGYYVYDTFAPDGAAKTMLFNDLFFASRHAGGAHFCLADGSVQFLDDGIDFTVYQDLATKSGEEATGAK